MRAILIDESGREARNDPSRANTRFGFKLKEGEELSKDEAIERLSKLWFEVQGERFSPGLGYFMLDVSLRFSPELAHRWLRLSLGLDQLASWGVVAGKLDEKTPRDIILLMDTFVRRRLKSEGLWPMCKHWWTNRANRARDRAVKWSQAGG